MRRTCCGKMDEGGSFWGFIMQCMQFVWNELFHYFHFTHFTNKLNTNQLQLNKPSLPRRTSYLKFVLLKTVLHRSLTRPRKVQCSIRTIFRVSDAKEEESLIKCPRRLSTTTGRNKHILFWTLLWSSCRSCWRRRKVSWIRRTTKAMVFLELGFLWLWNVACMTTSSEILCHRDTDDDLSSVRYLDSNLQRCFECWLITECTAMRCFKSLMLKAPFIPNHANVLSYLRWRMVARVGSTTNWK